MFVCLFRYLAMLELIRKIEFSGSRSTVWLKFCEVNLRALAFLQLTWKNILPDCNTETVCIKFWYLIYFPQTYSYFHFLGSSSFLILHSIYDFCEVWLFVSFCEICWTHQLINFSSWFQDKINYVFWSFEFSSKMIARTWKICSWPVICFRIHQR